MENGKNVLLKEGRIQRQKENASNLVQFFLLHPLSPCKQKQFSLEYKNRKEDTKEIFSVVFPWKYFLKVILAR